MFRFIVCTKFLTGLKTEGRFGEDLRSIFDRGRVCRRPANLPLAFNEIMRDGLNSSAAGARSNMAGDTFTDLRRKYRSEKVFNRMIAFTSAVQFDPEDANWWPAIVEPRLK